jgi:hypothetical protein
MRAKNSQGLGPDSTWTMPTLVNNSARTTTQTREVSESQPATVPITRTQCSVKKTAAVLKGIDDIRQLNKKKFDAKRKKEEEESKRKKDEEEVLKKAEEEKAKAIEEDNIAKNLHSIMNGIDGDKGILKIDGNEDDNKGVPNKTHKVLSPQENQTQTEEAPSILKTTKFIDSYIHPHRRIMLEFTITLTKEDTSDKFLKALTLLFLS